MAISSAISRVIFRAIQGDFLVILILFFVDVNKGIKAWQLNQVDFCKYEIHNQAESLKQGES